MERLTFYDDDGHALVPGTCVAPAAGGVGGAAIQRLAQFESFCSMLEARQAEITAELDALRNAGKKNTAKFKELLGNKLLNQNMLALLAIHGLRD